jgi:hypothetical protein
MTHGTPHDHPTCTTDATCNNHRTHLMTCREAVIRYAGDYQYRKQVDAGTATTEKPTFPKPEREKVPKAPKIGSKPRAPRVKAEPKPRRLVGVLGPEGLVHGSEAGYLRGCRDKDDCYAITVGLPSCVVVATTAGNIRSKRSFDRKRALAGRTKRGEAKHSTQSGYVQFKCRAGHPCPSSLAGGLSCAEAAAGAARVRYQAKRAA